MKKFFTLIACILITLTKPDILTAQQAEIVRDIYGVPHIKGEDIAGCGFGLGYAMSEDHPDKVIINIVSVRGELSKYFGEQYADQDFIYKSFGFIETVAGLFSGYPDDVKDYLTGYACGVNRFLSDHLDLLPEGVDSNSFFPVTPVDIATVDFIIPFAAEYFNFMREADSLHTLQINLSDNSLSNQWAVTPDLTSDGAGYLLCDPHLPFNGITSTYHAHILSNDGAINFEGLFFEGFNVPAMGHNAHIAWSFTANTPDYSDAFNVKIDPSDSTRYMLDGISKPFTIDTIFIEVAGQAEPLIRYSYKSPDHGVFTNKNPYDSQRYLFARLEVETAGSLIIQGLPMMKANTADEFMEAMSMNIFNRWNSVVMDDNYNMTYVYNARAHYRINKQAAIEARKHYLDGSVSETLWQAPIPFDDLPRVDNPDSHFLQNCNNPPWQVTYNPGIDSSSVPYELIMPANINNRGRRTYQYFQAGGDTMSFKYLKNLALDSKILTKDSLVPALQLGLSEAIANGNPDTLILSQLVDALANWDGFAKKEYQAPSLYYILRQMTPDTISFSRFSKIDSADRAVLMTSLTAAKNFMINNYGTVEIPWGEIHGISRNGVWYPLNGGTTAKDNMDANRLVNGDIDSLNRISVDRGNEFTMIIRLKNGEAPQAFIMKPYGQSTDTSSPHFSDLTELYSSDSLRPTFFTEAEFTANAESIETVSCESTVFSQEPTETESVSVFPNPTTGILTVEASDAVSISVIDITGKIIRDIRAENKTTIIDLRETAKGIYFVRVSAANNSVTRKIILK